MQAAGGTAIAEQKQSTASAARYGLIAALIGLLGLALDQVIKVVAIQRLDPQQPISLLGGLVTLQLIRNPGAAFSMGESFTPVITVIAIVAMIAVAGWAAPRVRHTGWAITMGLLLAGIAGNLCDRLFREPGPFRGHVVDFIQLPYFAIFNVADICITAAAVMVIWLTMITQVGLDGSSSRKGNQTKDVDGTDE